MLLLCRNGLRCTRVFSKSCCAQLSTQSQRQPDSEYTEVAEYPEIKDPSFRARKERETISWHDQIKNVPTVEEKLIKINMPRYWGYKVVELSEDKLPYNSLPAMQHYTRTMFEEVKEISGKQLTSEKLDSFVQAIKSEVEDCIAYAHDCFKLKYPDPTQLEPQQRERFFTQMLIEQLNRVLINALSADCTHLQEVEIDYNPRHEGFWAVGGIDPPKNVRKSKEGREWQKEMANDPIDRLMQYKGVPYLALRHRLQLPTWKSESESENPELAKQLPRYKYDPRTLGFVTTHQHGTNMPGYWPDSSSGFGCISYQSRARLTIQPDSYGPEYFKEALHMQAIQSSYAWLLAQANYNGFNTFNDLTYPMNTQTIVTNGRVWSFYEYQLNTLLVHSRHVDENPRLNFCRGTDELQLYQEVNDSGKCVGLDDSVLRHLVQFYANAPNVQRSTAELQPFLGADVKRIADYDKVEQREFLDRIYKHMTSNRPRHLAPPEIYLWEKIYKIDNKTRQLEAKRRFFELGINPWKRTMDQHQKEYIPRALRAEGPKSRKRWKPMYYP